MTEFIGFDALVLFGSGVLAAITALLVAAWLFSRRDNHDTMLFGFDRMDGGITFLLHGREVIDASVEGWRIVDADDGAQSRWQRLSIWLDQTFPDGSDRVLATRPKTPQQIVDCKNTPTQRLISRDIHGLTLVRVEPVATAPPVMADHEIWYANEAENADLRELAAKVPVAIWRTDREGQITWTNAAYLELLPQGSADIWPIPAVFSRTKNDGTGKQRRCLRGADGTESWFDHYIHPSDDSVLHFALPASCAARAEKTLHRFVQTLTQTFAHLSTGLAVFDKDRRLILFNPALGELTALETAWLSARPALGTFLDRLRERRMIAEPRDYASWRARMIALAEGSGYQEDWSLPDGQTYRVTGRPHPEGALAFLFEDITSELSLSRRFRLELDIGQNIIDSLDEALVVFSCSGTLVLSNKAYTEMWGDDPNENLATINLTDAIARWSLDCVPSPAMNALQDFFGRNERRVEWTAELRRKDGSPIGMRVVPLTGGATMVGFRCPDTPRHTMVKLAGLPRFALIA